MRGLRFSDRTLGSLRGITSVFWHPPFPYCRVFDWEKLRILRIGFSEPSGLELGVSSPMVAPNTHDQRTERVISEPLRCPRCQGCEIARSRRRWYEEPLGLVGLRPFRCRSCYCRFIMSIRREADIIHQTRATTTGV